MITYQLHKTLNSLIDQGLGDKALSNADYFGAVGTGENGELEYEETYPAAPVITFESAVKVPITKLAVYIEPVQSGSGDPSPDNIRPISGWDSVETVRTDANGGNRLTITTDLPSTVYGGVLDVISGELTVDRVLKVFDGSEAFLTRGDYAKLYNSGIQMLNSTSTPTAISSHFKRLEIGGWAELIENYFLIAGNTYIGLGFAGSVDELKTFLTEQYTAWTPVQVTGFLATPTTYTLTPEELNTLVGTNTIFANAGNVSVTKIALIKD